jgi:hypothetical protein
MFQQAVGDLSWQIERNNLFTDLYQRMVSRPGGIIPTYALLRTGGKETVLQMLEELDSKAIEKKDRGVDENYSLLNLLKNLTVLTNLSFGFTQDEWRNLVKYVVLTTDEALYGAPQSDSKTATMTTDQRNVYNLIMEYPFLLTVVLMESVLVEIVIEPAPTKTK